MFFQLLSAVATSILYVANHTQNGQKDSHCELILLLIVKIFNEIHFIKGPSSSHYWLQFSYTTTARLPARSRTRRTRRTLPSLQDSPWTRARAPALARTCLPWPLLSQPPDTPCCCLQTTGLPWFVVKVEIVKLCVIHNDEWNVVPEMNITLIHLCILYQ